MPTDVPEVRDEKDLERLIESRVMRMNAGVLALVAGILAAIVLFVLTNVLVLKGGPNPGTHLILLRNYLPGYTITFPGSLVGGVEAFAYGWIIVYAGARLYNWVVDLRHGRT